MMSLLSLGQILAGVDRGDARRRTAEWI